MTVYFIARARDHSQVKIGCTTNLASRLSAIAASFDQGIELLATCDGDGHTEVVFHDLCAEQRLEGEWFANTGPVTDMVRRYAGNVSGRRFWGQPRVVKGDGKDAVRRDCDLIHGELHKLLSCYGLIGTARAQEKAFLELFEINELWTRRRIQTLWNKSARRIDLYEMRDLKLLNAWKTTTWASEIAPEIKPERKKGKGTK